jgi:heme-degrading monooxygenase HmoA
VILEAATLDVAPARTAGFEAAFASARPLIEATPGFRKLELRPCIEKPGRYLLLVWWERLEDHTVGFRQSDRYEAWRATLHHFYDPFPVVEHFGEPCCA